MMESVPGCAEGERLVQRLMRSPSTIGDDTVSIEATRQEDLRRRLRKKHERVADEEKDKDDEEHVMHEWDAVAELRHAAMLVAKVLAA